MLDLIENATIHLRVSNFLCQKFFPPIFVSENQDGSKQKLTPLVSTLYISCTLWHANTC